MKKDSLKNRTKWSSCNKVYGFIARENSEAFIDQTAEAQAWISNFLHSHYKGKVANYFGSQKVMSINWTTYEIVGTILIDSLGVQDLEDFLYIVRIQESRELNFLVKLVGSVNSGAK